MARMSLSGGGGTGHTGDWQMQCDHCKTKGKASALQTALNQTDNHNEVKHGSKAPRRGARTIGI